MTGSEPRPQSFWLEHLDRANKWNVWVFEEMAKHVGRNVLEVGCGHGTYTALLGQSGARVTAMDIDSEFVSAAQKACVHMPNVTVSCGDVTQQSWSSTFDTVVLLDVLEHLADESGVLNSLAAALQPGGKLILKVPAFDWLFGAMDSAVGHHRRYSKESLSRAIEKAGLSTLSLWYFNAPAMAGWFWNGVVLRRVTPPAGQIQLFEKLLPAIKMVDRVTRPYFGLSLFAVAQKPHAAGHNTAGS